MAAGVVDYAFSQRAVFLRVPVFAVLAGIAVLPIPAEAINFDRARDLDREPDAAAATTGAAGYNILFKSRSLVVFGLCVMLFHLANASLLPLVGQKLAAAYPNEATAMMSACIVAAQAVMLPIALPVGRTADSWGRKPIFLAAFAILPIRAMLYTLSDDSFWLIGVQVLDGRRRDFRRPHTPGDRRYHARHRALQLGPRRHRRGPGDRRVRRWPAGKVLVHRGLNERLSAVYRLLRPSTARAVRDCRCEGARNERLWLKKPAGKNRLGIGGNVGLRDYSTPGIYAV